MADSESSCGPVAGVEFPPTHWSMVMNAGRDSSPDARAAFGRLYSTYRPALLAYLRGLGRTEPEAQDLVNGFFEFLLEKRGLSRVQRTGRFRGWLLKSLKHYFYDLLDKERALKRGGGQQPVPLLGEEGEPAIDLVNPGPAPDAAFHRQYALAFLQGVMSRLEEQYRVLGRQELFQILHPFLLEKKGDVSHAELGRRHAMNEDQVTQAITRLRRRYREVFDAALMELVDTAEEMEEEKQFLFRALSQ